VVFCRQEGFLTAEKMTMWIFGYGSLMWDDWETKKLSSRRAIATLLKFRRAFNKASVKNWGDRVNPGPTLQVVPDPTGQLKGVAFEFPDEQSSNVLKAVKEREGPNFELRELEVVLDDGNRVKALVPIYTGRFVIPNKSMAELAAMAKIAKGDEGKCFDYVKGIAEELKKLDIDDPVVQELWAAMQ
jgi:cation transport protein ChaC